MNIEYVRELLKKKEKEKLTDEDRERVSMLNILLKDDDIFFNIEANTACGILEFLGIQGEKNIIDDYYKLISFEEYKKSVGYIINKDDKNEEER